MARALFIPTLLDEVTEQLNACSKGACGGVNLYEDEQAFHLEAPIPGVKPEDIKVSFEQGGISIEGAAAEEKSNVKYHFRSSSNYRYWVPLPTGQIDETATPDATLSQYGILKVTLPKARAARPQKIQVKSA